jgi:hypothetical protein
MTPIVHTLLVSLSIALALILLAYGVLLLRLHLLNFKLKRQLAKLAGVYKDINWTTTPPTKAGYWWVKLTSDPITIIVAVDNDLCVWDAIYRRRMPLSEATHWLGPIPEPPMPESSRIIRT